MGFYTNLQSKSDLLNSLYEVWEGSSMEQPYVDFRYLQQVTLSNRELAKEVLDLFARQVSIYLIDLKNAQTREDLMYLSHTIKGAGRSIGANRLAEVAAHIERSSLYPSMPDTEAAIHNLEQEITHVLFEIKTFKRIEGGH